MGLQTFVQICVEHTTEIQRQHNLPILAIRSDNGSEFKNYTLDEFLSEEGIRHQYKENPPIATLDLQPFSYAL